MFALFQSEEKAMNTLDEKQIQERLYGKYHKGSSNSLTSTEPKRQSFPTLPVVTKEEKLAQAPVVTENVSVLDSILTALSHVPWRFIGILAGAFVVTLLLVNMVAYFLGKTKADHAHIAGGRLQGPKAVAVEKISSAKTQQPETVKEIVPVVQKVKLPEGMGSAAKSEKIALAETSAAATTVVAEPTKPLEKVVKQRFYGVQICTYQRQADAQTLVSELNQRGFNAFFKEVPSQQKEFYVVYLNRSKTYAEAQHALNKFKQSDLHSRFRDSFIRSI